MILLTTWNLLVPLIQHIDVIPARASTEFVNPHISLTTDEASAPQATDEFASVSAPIYGRVGSSAPAPENEILTDIPVIQVMGYTVEVVQVASLQEQNVEMPVPRISEQIIDSPVVDYIAPAPPVTISSPTQQLPPARTSFLERLTEQVSSLSSGCERSHTCHCQRAHCCFCSR